MQPIGRPCGIWMYEAMRDAMDMGQQLGYRSLEWNRPKEAIIIIIIEGLSLSKEAMNIPIWAGIVDGAKLF